MRRNEVLNMDRTGKNLKKLISCSPYTFEDIANFLNLASPRVIYDWVNGIKLPSLSNLVLISKLFKVHLEDILFIEDVF